MSVDTTVKAIRTGSGARGKALPHLIKAGLGDIEEGARNWRVWYLMGSGEMRRRFQRSRLGPLWIAISTGVMVSCIGVVWSMLWSADVADILPFIALSLVSWQFLLGTINDATICFPGYSGYFSNQRLAPSNVIYAIVYKNFITYAINLSVPLMVCIGFGVPLRLGVLLALPAIALQVCVIFCVAYMVAIFCTRFRDVVQVVQNAMQLVFFVTPILWKPDLLPIEARQILVLNPFAHLLQIVRDPFLGNPPSIEAWSASALFLGALVAVLIPLVGRCHRRIVYWL